ncbi:ABC transporter permease [Halomarina pelagica]|uniref:ABC transporter permease n=1 Tax=Halomarina pelagica TaxID=2961599 RepID=UPI0020C38CCD|nr:ABC transporter permease [Halomarina sp. BND7]
MSNETVASTGWRGISRAHIAGGGGLLLALFAIVGLLFPTSWAGVLLDIVTRTSTLASTLRLAVPIALAAVGGIFAEKSGVINIGLEGLLIVSAFTAIYGVDVTGSVWLGFLLGVAASVLLAAVFAVVCIEFRADQIIAGLAIWLVALGLAPFLSQVIYDQINTAQVATFTSLPRLIDSLGVPAVPELLRALGGIPFFGALFTASPTVYLMFLSVAVGWYVLNRTPFGRWVRASGENPKALDTVGVSVHRVRYAAVLLSGVFAGMGGASLALSLGQFTGGGQTMVNGKGFIAIVAYLFGNYNPVGALLSTMLFAGLEAVQIRLQSGGFGVPNPLVRLIPYVSVIVVLALVGRTKIPAAAGEHYESGED